MESEHVTQHDAHSEICIHHWLINEKNFGVCKKCRASKQFNSGSWYDASLRKTSQTKSSKVPQGAPNTKS
jgi:hypothetical protein